MKKIVALFSILALAIMSLSAMEKPKSFSVRYGFVKTFKDYETYIPFFMAAVADLCKKEHYPEFGDILLDVVKSPVTIVGTLGSILRHSFSEKQYEKIPSLGKVVLEHPYLTTFTGYVIRDIIRNRYSQEDKSMSIAFALGSCAYLLYEFARTMGKGTGLAYSHSSYTEFH